MHIPLQNRYTITQYNTAQYNAVGLGEAYTRDPRKLALRSKGGELLQSTAHAPIGQVRLLRARASGLVVVFCRGIADINGGCHRLK